MKNPTRYTGEIYRSYTSDGIAKAVSLTVIDNRELKEVKLRILEILLSDEIPDPVDVVLICLANACSLFPSILSPKDLAPAWERIQQVAKMDLIGQKMIQEIRNVHDTVVRVGWWGASSPEPEEPEVH